MHYSGEARHDLGQNANPRPGVAQQEAASGTSTSATQQNMFTHTTGFPFRTAGSALVNSYFGKAVAALRKIAWAVVFTLQMAKA